MLLSYAFVSVVSRLFDNAQADDHGSPRQIRWLKRRGKKELYADASGSSLFRNLMVADLLQASGSLPIARWMRDGVSSHHDYRRARISQNGISPAYYGGIDVYGTGGIEAAWDQWGGVVVSAEL